VSQQRAGTEQAMQTTVDFAAANPVRLCRYMVRIVRP
jgi:hypothetical protein